MAISLQADPTLPQGYIKVNGTTAATVTTSGITANVTGNATTATTATTLSTASGSAPVYGCRAWVNFDGTRDASGAASTVNTNRLIRSNGNVSSVLRNGTGDYTVNFSTPMADANYSVSGSAAFYDATTDNNAPIFSVRRPSTANPIRVGSVQVQTNIPTSLTGYDCGLVCIQIFGN